MSSGDLVPGDDFGMMREMLRRRFGRLVKEAPRDRLPAPHAEVLAEGGPRSTLPGSRPEGADGDGASFEAPLRGAPQDEEREPDDPDAFPAWPDLVLIDGGQGQLEAARAALAEVGATGVALVGIAKGRDRDAGRETFFVPGRAPVRLPPRDPALYFVQRLRDEAHRFAIGTHRAKRKREMTKSGLDEIPGIGPARKRALLQHFGTLRAIERAALDDLMRIPGVNAATARLVFDHFRGTSG